jgi:hypothetical protein
MKMAAFAARSARLIAAASLLGALALAAVAAPAQYKIVTASERGTYIQIGRDIAKFVAPAADIELEVLPSAGSAENVQRLRYEPGVKFALVQSDVYQAFLDQAAGGNTEAGTIIRPLRVIMPLYNEEIYFIARSDAPINFVHEIKDAKINVGPLRSGTAMSATTIYRQLFGAALPDANASFLSNEEALVKLVSDKSLDVRGRRRRPAVQAAGRHEAEARQLIKLLKFDRPTGQRDRAEDVLSGDDQGRELPERADRGHPGAAVKAFLVTYDYTMGGSVSRLRGFARSLCQNFPKLQAKATRSGRKCSSRPQSCRAAGSTTRRWSVS